MSRDKEVLRAIDFWQEQLRLMDWQIDYSFVTSPESRGRECLAIASSYRGTHRAYLELKESLDWEHLHKRIEGEAVTPWELVGHELTHLLLSDCGVVDVDGVISNQVPRDLQRVADETLHDFYEALCDRIPTLIERGA